jgi:hypothetical protein
VRAAASVTGLSALLPNALGLRTPFLVAGECVSTCQSTVATPATTAPTIEITARLPLRERRPRLGRRSRLGAQDRDAEPDPRALEDEKPDVVQPD